MTPVPPSQTPPSGPSANYQPGPLPTPPSGVQDGFSWRRFLMFAGIIVVLAAGATVLLWYVGSSLGFRATMIGLVAAILPVPLLVACFLWLGRHNPVPAKYLMFCFAWGACIATAVSLGVNTLGHYLWSQVYAAAEQEELTMILTSTTVAPVIEEIMKALGPLLIFWFRRKYFTSIIDGIVLCGLSAVGFAMMENILYLAGGYISGYDLQGAATGVLTTMMLFLVRIVLTGFAHPLFTVMFGIGLGLSLRRKGAGRWLVPMGMILVSIMLHSAWNLFASIDISFLVAGYISIMVPVFLTTVGAALWLRAAEARLPVKRLGHYVSAGWISPPELASVATYRRRSSARLWAKRVAGTDGQRAMRDYQHIITQLALLCDRFQRGIASPDDPAKEHYLINALVRSRSVFTGRDPVTPSAVWDGRYYQIQFPDGSVRQVNPPGTPVMPIPVVMAPTGGYGAPVPGMPWMPPGQPHF